MKRELFPEHIEKADNVMVAKNIPVRPAATLLLVDWEKKPPRLLVGKRKSTLAFMPGLTVFPGGAVDAADTKMQSADDLSKQTLRRLRLRASRLSERGARALALAAIRELYEETGLMHGLKQKPDRSPTGWEDFAAHGITPTLANLHLVARAITPPYRPRRFDTRFLLADRKAIAKTVKLSLETDLEKIKWLTLAQILKQPLAFITRQILTDLTPLLRKRNAAALAGPFSFYYVRGNRYFRESIG